MEKIKVYSNKRAGLGHGRIFDNIVLLYNDGFLDDVGIIRASEDSIITSTHEFVKEEKFLESVDENIKLERSKGATWFAGLRDQKEVKKDIRNDIAVWQKFIEKTSENFHKNFSLLEYAPISSEATEAEIKNDKKLISNIISLLMDETDFVIEERKLINDKEDIYGASLRMQLTDGVGEAKPVLSRVFFKTDEGERGIIPVKSSDVYKINEMLKAFDSTDTNEDISLSGEKTVPAIMHSLQDLFSKPNGFQDYIHLEDQRDIDTVDAIRNRGAEGITTIYCRSIDVLGVFHVSWAVRKYVVKMGDIDVFEVVFGAANSISFKCILCGTEKIIDNNKIVLSSINKTIVIYPTQENLGLTDVDWEDLLEYNPFASHAFFIQCKVLHISGGVCQKRVCEKDSFYVDKTSYIKNYPPDLKVEKLCKNCPYLEQVYVIDDNYYHTPQLSFCSDTIDLLPRNQSYTCRNCGRTFAKELDSNGFCGLCSTVIKGDNSKYKNMYGKYFEILPLSEKVRYVIATIKKDKSSFVCHEDADLIIFKANKKLLIYDKSHFSTDKPIRYIEKELL